MNSVYIKRIEVTKLFGTINYDIDLSVGEPTAIIIAPNGMGKTTILNLISHVFDPNYDSFVAIRDIPFEKFCCELSNGIEIAFTKMPAGGVLNNYPSSAPLVAKLMGGSNFSLDFWRKGKHDRSKSVDYYNTLMENEGVLGIERLSRYIRDKYPDDPDMIEEAEVRTKSCFEVIWDKQIEKLDSAGCNIDINYIRANRIQPVLDIDEERPFRRQRPTQTNPLIRASKSIADDVMDVVDKYNKRVSEAKDRLPKLFLEESEDTDVLSYEEFSKRWGTYQYELGRYQEVGLIPQDKEPLLGTVKESDYSNPVKQKFLSVYINAFENTTAPLRDIYRRLKLFKNIFEERNAITGKKITFTKDGVVIDSNGQTLDLLKLSSGERHDFIMFYDLIFQTKKNALVLIDEPEISLHIEWQESFLDRLIEICKMNDLHAIIATHSPNIVNSHYDCIVDKGETNG